jgi:putative component of membrane protein insertase Oxa1/YidC/SpoIIIJ protein YidD
MRALALAAIGGYQRYLSPYKGFCCAYRAHTGHASCSALGLRAIRRFGVWRGLALLQRRLDLCGVAHRRYRAVRLQAQRGEVDADCGGADSWGLPGDGGVCDVVECCDDGDRSRSRRRRRSEQEERQIHVPPARWPGEERDRR